MESWLPLRSVALPLPATEATALPWRSSRQMLFWLTKAEPSVETEARTGIGNDELVQSPVRGQGGVRLHEDGVTEIGQAGANAKPLPKRYRAPLQNQ